MTTDRDGFFETDVPPGEYVLKFYHRGSLEHVKTEPVKFSVPGKYRLKLIFSPDKKHLRCETVKQPKEAQVKTGH